MIKKLFCIALAAVMVLCLCACSKENAGNDEPGLPEPSAVPSEPAADDGENNTTTHSEDEIKNALDGIDDDLALISFTGAKEAQVTAGQLKQAELYDYTESQADDTPVFSGPLVRDVLALIGAENAESFTVVLGSGAYNQSFSIKELDLDTALFGVLKDGKLIGEGRCVLICVTHDGFSYVQEVNEPLVLD